MWAGLLIVRLPPDASGFRLVLARGWHGLGPWSACRLPHGLSIAWHTVHMGEVARRVPAVVSRASGNMVGPAVAALCSMAGVAFGEPALIAAAMPVGAVAGSVTEEALSAAGSLWQQRRDHIQRFADEAETSPVRPWSNS